MKDPSLIEISQNGTHRELPTWTEHLENVWHSMQICQNGIRQELPVFYLLLMMRKYLMQTFQNGTPETYNGANPGPVCFNTPGTYTITLTVSNTFGSNQTAQSVDVGATPSVEATLSDTTNGAYVEIPDTTIFMYQEAYLFASGTPPGGNMMWYPSGVASEAVSPESNDSLTVTPFYDT